MAKQLISSKTFMTVLCVAVLMLSIVAWFAWQQRNGHKGPRSASEAIEVALDFSEKQAAIDSKSTARAVYEIDASRQQDGSWIVLFTLKPDADDAAEMEDHFSVKIDAEYGLEFFGGM